MMFFNKTILVVDDEVLIIETLKELLTGLGFQVTTAQSGLEAQGIVSLKKFDVVLTDLHMSNSRVGGLELMYHIRRTNPQPVILMTSFATFSEAEKQDREEAAAFLAKPFKPEELIAALKTIVQVTEYTPPPKNLDSEYSKISIDDFISGKMIQYNIFVRMSESKYVKIAHQGEDLSIERIRAYKEKDLHFLYLKKEDFYKYLQLNLHLSKVVKHNSTIPAEKKRHLLRHTGELLLENIYTNTVDKVAFDLAKTLVETTVGFLTESDDTFYLLDTLNNHSDFLYAHSLAVSVYSVLLAKALGWNSAQLLYKLSIAGVMHDIGKKEIPREVIGKRRTALSLEEVQLLESHCQRGLEILRQVRTIPSDVVQMVYHHHERDTGAGYPLRLTKNKIHPLARVLAFADEFCELVVKSPKNPEPVSPKEALEHLEMFHKETFDPVFFTALKKIINGEVK